MSNQWLINRRTGGFLGLFLLILGLAGIGYDAMRPRSQPKQFPANIDRAYLIPPAPPAMPKPSPFQASPATDKARVPLRKILRRANRGVRKNHAPGTEEPKTSNMLPTQTESPPLESSSAATDKSSRSNISLSQQPAITQPSPIPGTRCTPLTQPNPKNVGIFKRVLNLIKRLLGMKQAPIIVPNQPPVVSSFTVSTASILMACPAGLHSASANCPINPSSAVQLTTTASDPDGDTLLYTYSTTGGRITGDGANVAWDLSGLAPGTYTASVEVDDARGCVTFASETVTIANCPDCRSSFACPRLTVDQCDDAVPAGTTAIFHATFTQGTPQTSPIYNWTVSAGTIVSGDGTDRIAVDTTGLAGQSITATVEVGGVDPSCDRKASCTTAVFGGPPPTPSPTPSHTATPTPYPPPINTPSPATSPTPTPAASPIGQASPCASPTPVPKDFIEITYPEYMLAGDNEEEIRVTLSPADGRISTSAERPGPVRRFFRWLGALFGKAPSPPAQPQVGTPFKANVEDWCRYDGSARAEIDPTTNVITVRDGNRGDGYQSLDSSEALTWIWFVKGNRNGTVPLKIRLYFLWKSKILGIPDKRPIEVWPNDGRVFQVSVQEPTIWNLVLSVTSWLIAGVGTTLMSIFIGPWIKRRLKRWTKKYK